MIVEPSKKYYKLEKIMPISDGEQNSIVNRIFKFTMIELVCQCYAFMNYGCIDVI